jgi:glycosyltransferase involved in cell wall biosynthesis
VFALSLFERSVRFAWRLARWPLRHRRLPNRADVHHLVAHLRHVVNRPANQIPNRDPYEVWLENNRWTGLAREAAQKELDELERRPLISVVMPVHNVDACWLERAIESVQTQVYPDWELCIAEDCATVPHIRPLLRDFAASDSRIRVRYLSKNLHISRATNAAAELAGGEFLLFLDQDDELTPDCLLEVAKAIVAGADIVYSDYDKMDLAGRRFDPVFKPDWSPELLLSYMYFGHVFAVRRDLFVAEGGCRGGFEGCQDFDLALRLTDKPRRIVHIPRVLYHWRCLPTSTASSGAAKPEAFERGRRAVQEAVSRRGISATVSRPPFAVRGNYGLFQLDFPDTGPRVAVLVSTQDRCERLPQCVQSIRTKTSYRDYEIVILDNGEGDRTTRRFLSRLPLGCRAIQVGNSGKRLSPAEQWNAAAAQVDADFLLFLSDDVEVNRPEWLSQMIGYAQINGVGAVGARLILLNKTVHQAGIVVGSFNRPAAPAFQGLHESHYGYMSTMLCSHNCSGVSADCLLVRRDAFLDMDGFDSRFAASYHDIDLCLRLNQRGLRCVYAPQTDLTIHRESAIFDDDGAADAIAFREIWGEYRDPYYNPNLAMNEPSHQIETRRTMPSSATPTSPLKVLFCTHNLKFEGAPLSLFELVRGLAERGIVEPHVFSHEDGPLGELYRQQGIPVHVDPELMQCRPGVDGFRSRAVQFSEWILSQGFDLLLANTLDTFWTIHGAQMIGLPSLWIIRESCSDIRRYYEVLGPWMVAPAEQTFAYPYRIIFVARATRALYAPVSSYRNMSVIPNGLRRDKIDRFRQLHERDELRRELGIPVGRTVFLITGTVCERKGQLEFAQAAIRLIERGRRDVLFLIVGCFPSEYQARIEELLEPHSEFFQLVPTTDKSLHYLFASDVFVCCSRNESYPRVILEAMAAEIPIITTPVFGIAEQVSHNFSALTYAPGDVETLAAHMVRLADRSDERDRLRRGAIRQFNSLTSYDQMLAQYERLIIEAAMTRETSNVVQEMSGTETGVK